MMRFKFSNNALRPLCGSMFLLPLLAGCVHDDDPVAAIDLPPSSSGHAVISTDDYASGATTVISVDQPRTVINDISPTNSDIAIVTNGNDFYRIEGFNNDNIAKFNIDNPADVIWQYSTMDATDIESSNPRDLIVASNTKAYLLRYGNNRAWIVNPEATTQNDFKVGELDLSVYDTLDHIPEMDSGIIVNGKLFIVVQALNRNAGWSPEQAYVAVFDVASNGEIDTGKSGVVGINGISLPIKNPDNISYSADTGLIYVQGNGGYSSPVYEGGIISIDPDTYDVQMVLDDDNNGGGVSLYGKIANFALVSPTKGYFVGYHDWQDNALYSFNPSTGEVNPNAVANLFGKDIGDLTVSPLGNLWVGNRSDFGVVVIDPVTDAPEPDILSTGALPPLTISFTQ